MVRGSHTRSRIANGAGYAPAFNGQGNNQGVVTVPGGLGEPAGSIFGVFQNGGYNDENPFNGLVNANSGTITANTNSGPPQSPFGVTGGATPVFAGGRTHAVSGATSALNASAATQQMYIQYGLIFLAVVAGAYLLIREYKK